MFAGKKLVEIRTLNFEDAHELHLIAIAIAVVTQDDKAQSIFIKRGFSDVDLKKLRCILDTIDMNFA